MRPSGRLLPIFLCAALGACTYPTRPASDTQTAGARAPAIIKVEQALAYFHTLRSLPPEELEKEYARLEQNQDAPTRLRRALLLSLPEREFSDSEQALTLLDAYLAQAAPDDAARDLALLLADFVAERRDYERQLQSSEKRVETLEQQLEELKSIENSINRRDQPGDAKKP